MQRMTHQVVTNDGIRISFDLYQMPNRSAVVIICPGFFQSKETPTFQRLARTLANHHDVICMDFRGHGRSRGRFTFSTCEPADLDAVLRWAQARYQRIGILGFSLGAAIAINTISKRPGRVQSLIAVSAPATFEEIEFRWWTPEAMRTGLEGLEPGAGCRPGNMLLKKARPIENVQKLKSILIFFIHGTRDVIVGVQHSRRLYAAASESKRLEIIEGGGHAEALFRDDPEHFCHLVEAWWMETLLDHAA